MNSLFKNHDISKIFEKDFLRTNLVEILAIFEYSGKYCRYGHKILPFFEGFENSGGDGGMSKCGIAILFLNSTKI